VPDLVALDLPAMAAAAGYPGTRVIPAVSWLLSLLALKLTATRRVSHVDDLLDDPASALFAGLAILPKKSALTDYSYRLSHDHQHKFLAALDAKMIGAGLATAAEAVFDLDFHAVMHWGSDPVLEKHYVPTRSQRARPVLTFFAQDPQTRNLIYASADISKATQNREVIAFCDHWKNVTGTDPAMLVMDQKVTTQDVLGELGNRGVRFLTLRMRSPALLRHISALKPADFKTITLDRPGPHNKPRVHEDKAVRLTSYPGTVRQLIVTGLGRDQPTVIISNEHQAPRSSAHSAQTPCPPPSTSTSTWTSCSLSWPRLCSPRSAQGSAPATPPPPPTPSSGASWTAPEPSPSTTTRSPSASTAGPTHPSCATPPSRPTPPCPGGTAGGGISLGV
jgi:hypothetical protein